MNEGQENRVNHCVSTHTIFFFIPVVIRQEKSLRTRRDKGYSHHLAIKRTFVLL
jgi:hypothetical protein